MELLRTAAFAIGPWALTLVAEGSERGPHEVGVPDVATAKLALEHAVGRAPTATAVLADLLRVTAQVDVEQGLVAESLAYSTLMAGGEHLAWLENRTARPVPDAVAPPVLLERDGDVLTITLNRPDRHNAYGREVRDALCDALEFVEIDDSISAVHVRGAGGSFCSGGDLDEFGTSRDVAIAHLIRRERSAAALMNHVGDRVTVHLHGACIGAGIEIPSFARHVVASDDTTIRLPEVAMGLIPGAGGTVGITRRIGPWRTLFLAVTGSQLPVSTALAWGLVDELVP